MAAGDQLESVRAGSHWLYAEPNGDEVKAWFDTQPLHPGMKPDPYLGGIVVIPQVEKVKVTRRNASDQMFVVEEERAAYTPYVKVDTRVRYFWDYVTVLNGGKPSGDYVGVIQPAQDIKRITDRSSAFYNEHLPPGYLIHAIRNGNSSIKHFVVAVWEAAIYERQSYLDSLNGKHVIPILKGRGTKQVPTNFRGDTAWADEACMMKAETGAIGRALGVAGILVVGTGVASAEDMQEATTVESGSPGGTPPAPALPPVVDREGAPVGEEAAIPANGAQEAAAAPEEATPAQEGPQTDEEMRAHAEALRTELEQRSPEAWAAYVAWYTEDRKFPPLEKLTGSALKGAVVKLERTLDEVKQAAG